MPRNFSFLFLVVVAFLASACSDSAIFVHEITLRTQARPPAWAGLPTLEYSVVWMDNEGVRRVENIREGDELKLRLRRGESCGIAANVSSGSARLRPAGALYPRGLEPGGDSVLELDFLSGYVNAIAGCIERSGKVPWTYPLEKLKTELSAKGVDPWAVSPFEAAEALVYGRFRIDRYTHKAEAVLLPQGGSWIPESPFCKIERDDTRQRAFLTEGITVFFDEGKKLIVLLKEGESLFQIVPLQLR